MNITPKYKWCRIWLAKGRKLTAIIAFNNVKLMSLKTFVERERRKLEPQKTIINLNDRTGLHGIYIHSDFAEKFKDEIEKMNKRINK